MKICLILILAPIWALAQPQHSENFRMTKSVLDAGGAESFTANLHLSSVVGQPTPTGVQASENFFLSAGFLSPNYGISPLSPIQRLVIQPQAANIWLYWEPIAGAYSYAVHADSEACFAPNANNLIGTTADTIFVDVNAVAGPAVRRFYSVSVNTEPLRETQSSDAAVIRVSTRNP